MELRIGDRSVDLTWSTIVVAPVPGRAPSPQLVESLIDRGADAVLISVDGASSEPARATAATPFCCEVDSVAAAHRVFDLGASFVVASASVAAELLESFPPSVVVVADPPSTSGTGPPADVPRLRDLRVRRDGPDEIDVADLVAAVLLDVGSPVRVLLVDDPRPARRCADLVETLRRELAGVAS